MLEIRELKEQDILMIAESFKEIGWNKPVSQYQQYLAEQSQNLRKVLIAFWDDKFVGYLTIIWESQYPHFKSKQIPEIQDFNVLPNFRRKRIGSKLMDKAEEIISEQSSLAGIGVGMNSDYGAAQRLYVLRGYVPDGKGIVWQNHFPKYGDAVLVDDDLNLFFTKELR